MDFQTRDGSVGSLQSKHSRIRLDRTEFNARKGVAAISNGSPVE
jgi:hypothetical protein